MGIMRDDKGTPILNDLFSVANSELTTHSIIQKFGHGVVGTALGSIWNGSTLYNWKPSASTLNIASSDVNDATGNTGARTLTIFGLDSDYNEISEEISLTGQTIVSTVNSYLRVYRIIVRSAGSSGWNEGSIYAFTGTATSGVPDDTSLIYAKILFDATFAIGQNQTLMAVYTVPAGKKAHISKVYFNQNTSKTTEVFIFARPLGEVFQVKYRGMIAVDQIIMPENYILTFDEKTDIDFQAGVGTGTTDISAGFIILLVDK